MANDPTRQVHTATHPSGHPNKTPVNAQNPIFHNQPDVVAPQVSVEQVAVVQGAKEPARETAQSPLINEEVVRPALTSEDRGTPEVAPSSEDLDAVAADPSIAPTIALDNSNAGIGSEPVDLTETPESPEHERFNVGDKVRFTAESGNDSNDVYTIDGGERGEGEDARWFWRLAEKPGGLFLSESLAHADHLPPASQA